jgi:hypothetical protein
MSHDPPALIVGGLRGRDTRVRRLAAARLIGATVGTGSLVRKSSTIVLTSPGFSWMRKCEVPGTTAGSAFGNASYWSTSGAASPLLLKPPLIITSRSTNSCRCIATSIATNARRTTSSRH